MSFNQPDLFGESLGVAGSATTKTAHAVPARSSKSSSKSKSPLKPVQSPPSLFSSLPVAFPVPTEEKYVEGEKVVSEPGSTTPLEPISSPPAQWGLCRICGSPIAIPGNDADLCSNPARTCGSSGWVDNPKWGFAYSEAVRQQTQRGGKKS